MTYSGAKHFRRPCLVLSPVTPRTSTGVVPRPCLSVLVVRRPCGNA